MRNSHFYCVLSVRLIVPPLGAFWLKSFEVLPRMKGRLYMRKIKLLTALLAIVMVLPSLVGIGTRASADGPVMQLLVYLKNPTQRSTFESLHLPKLSEYAQGSILTEATTDQVKSLGDNNIDFVTIGRADVCIVGGMHLSLDKAGSKLFQIEGLENSYLKNLAAWDYKGSDFAYYVVRFVGPMKKVWIDKINSMGAKILDGYPLWPDTYLVRMNKADVQTFAQLDFVRAYTIHNPALKASIFPQNKEKNQLQESVVITVAGGLNDAEIANLSKTLQGLGCKSLVMAQIERFDEQKPPTQPEDMKDEEYKQLLEFWKQDRKAIEDYYNGPVTKNSKMTVRQAAQFITFGTSGSVNELTQNPLKGEFEVAFTTVIAPAASFEDIAKIPFVLNIDSFSAPEAQNDIANYTIGSQWAWAASELSGVVPDGTTPLPHARLDHFGLHGESLQGTQSYIGGTHYRQIVAVVGTGLDTGDVEETGYVVSDQYGAGTGDFGGRVVDHLAYVRKTSSWGNYTNQGPYWRWPPGTGGATRSPRGYWANINRYVDVYTAGVQGSRTEPWMDWDGHDTHVTGSGFGDGYWSRGSTPTDDAQGRNPYGQAPTYAPNTSVAPGTALSGRSLPILSAPFGNTSSNGPWDYRGVAYRAGIIVQRVTENNFNDAYNYPPYYRLYWTYVGRPRYLGLYSSNIGLPESGYLRAPDSVFTIINDAYQLGARIQVNAWVMPHRGTAQSNTPPSPVGDREITYDGNIYNSNEYNYCANQMDRYCWERKDMLLVNAGTTNTRFAAPFIYDFEPYDWQQISLPAGSRNWYTGNAYYSSPWCFTTPNAAQYYNPPNLAYPVSIPNKGVYYPPIGDTSQNLPVEFNYYYQNITQPPTTVAGWPAANADGKTDFGTSCLSPATAKNPIVVGASESYRAIQQWAPYNPISPTTPNRPWTYNSMYGGWFPLNPLASDNTANSGAPQGWTHSAGAVTMWVDDATNGYGQVAAFSGRGPTPDLDYSQGNPDPNTWNPAGRFKPDIVAPGTQIMSTASYLTNKDIGVRDPGGNYTGNNYDGIRQVNDGNVQLGGPYLMRHPSTATPGGGGHGMYRHYAIMEGTSCATGFVAGAAAVTRQYYQNRGLTLYPHPQSALIKATLIHGAKNLGGQLDYDINPPQNYNDWFVLSAKPSYDQGFGRLDIHKSLFPDAPTAMTYEDHISGITTGERHAYYYDVLDDTVPFEATLCWTDMPKHPNPQVALANDLDLIVIDPGGTEYHGNVYTTDPHVDDHTNVYESWGRISLSNPGGTNFDRRNNVERVVIPPVQVKKGTWTVTVSGSRVEQSSTNIPQTYAFVVSGGNLRSAVTPPPEVPMLGTYGLIAIIAGVIAIGAFFLFRKKEEVA